MRLFIAGGSGVIGRRLVPSLVQLGHEVVGVTRTPSGAALLREAGAQPVLADVFDRAGLIAIVRAARPEIVIHQLTDLGAADPVANAALRTRGTRHLVDAALAAGARRIVAQSIAWAYAAGLGPAREDEPLDLSAGPPRATTIAGIDTLERAAAELPESVILRYGLLYGPSTWYAQDGSMAQKVRRGELQADAAVSSFVHVSDAARACVLALASPTGTFNVCDDAPAPATEWLPVFARCVGAAAPVMVASGAAWARGADNRKGRATLGLKLQFPHWRSGFERGLG
jgi:nucleoside-diphosphate-sugar epimerase